MCSLRYFLIALTFTSITTAQQFSSGSSGADGALDLTSGDRVVQLPPSGILNYTTVSIPQGRTLSFQLNQTNTPVIMLAQGIVSVAGTINLSASGRVPGPGGFYGGDLGGPGLGPGGGQPGGQINGHWVGPLSLVPIIGGSGGAGAVANCIGGGGPVQGGGGGGAITVAASSITITGRIVAQGSITTPVLLCSGEASGSGGAIRLIANAINVVGCTSSTCSDLEAAVVRLEAPVGQVSYGAGGTPPVISTINPKITLNNPPALQIVSIGGYPVPSYAGSSFNSIDLLLPTQLPDPIPVVVQATNVPTGSPVNITFSGSSNAVSTTASLAGSTAVSTATLYISNLNRAGVSFLFVSATFDPTLVSLNLDEIGPNAISTVQLATTPGANTQYRFLRHDGSQVPTEQISAELRRLFGL